MSLLSWMFPFTKPAKPLPESSGMSRMEATRPVRREGRNIPIDNAQPANRKNERIVRRELLYSVVREAMVKAGVLSASYKFKVLSLDGRGRQFLVMVDLARECGIETTQLAEIEAMVAQSAKARHDILVSAVYWRMNEYVAVGEPKAQPVAGAAAPTFAADSQPAVLDSSPAPLSPLSTSAGTPQSPALQPAVTQGAARSRFEPIRSDEVAAFRRALAAGAANPAAVAAAAVGVQHGARAVSFDGTAKHGPQSYTLLTGFEDTELAEEKGSVPVLSGTQYGELN